MSTAWVSESSGSKKLEKEQTVKYYNLSTLHRIIALVEYIVEDSSYPELDIIRGEVCPVVSATTQFWEEFKHVTRPYVETEEVKCTLPTFYPLV